MRLITLTTLLGAGLALPLDTELNQFSAPTPNDTPLTRRDEGLSLTITEITGHLHLGLSSVDATVEIPDAGIKTRCHASNSGITNHCEDKRVKIEFDANFFSNIRIKYNHKKFGQNLSFLCQSTRLSSILSDVRLYYLLIHRHFYLDN